MIGYQVDNETSPNGVPTEYTTAAFVGRLKQKYKTPETINKLWGLVYWGQLVSMWEDLPTRHGILNPGYKLEWENFQHDIVTDYLAWQARIVNEYKRPDQFVTTCFSGGIHTNLDQWAIARNLDIVAVNPYFETQDRLEARGIWFTGDLARSLKRSNYLVAETNAQTIGWDSRTQYPPYPGQLRLAVYTHVAPATLFQRHRPRVSAAARRAGRNPAGRPTRGNVQTPSRSGVLPAQERSRPMHRVGGCGLMHTVLHENYWHRRRYRARVHD